jgi:hypothetical protein
VIGIWGRILWRNWEFSSLLFTVNSTNRFYPHPPWSKSGLKLVCNVNIGYGNHKSENSDNYAQKPQRNCTFLNSASGHVTVERKNYLAATTFWEGKMAGKAFCDMVVKRNITLFTNFNFIFNGMILRKVVSILCTQIYNCIHILFFLYFLWWHKQIRFLLPCNLGIFYSTPGRDELYCNLKNCHIYLVFTLNMRNVTVLYVLCFQLWTFYASSAYDYRPHIPFPSLPPFAWEISRTVIFSVDFEILKPPEFCNWKTSAVFFRRKNKYWKRPTLFMLSSYWVLSHVPSDLPAPILCLS